MSRILIKETIAKPCFNGHNVPSMSRTRFMCPVCSSKNFNIPDYCFTALEGRRLDGITCCSCGADLETTDIPKGTLLWIEED
jgi:hypothetical protein